MEAPSTVLRQALTSIPPLCSVTLLVIASAMETGPIKLKERGWQLHAVESCACMKDGIAEALIEMCPALTPGKWWEGGGGGRKGPLSVEQQLLLGG